MNAIPLPFAIEAEQRLSYSKALPLLVQAWHEMIEAGLIDGHIPIHWQDRAVVAIEPELGKAIGVISYAPVEWTSSFDMKIGYVSQRWRRRGVYRALWNRLVQIAQAEGVRRIIGTTRATNDAMRATAAALGRSELGVYLTFDVSSAKGPRGS